MSSSGMGRDVHSMFLCSIFSANHGIAHPLRCLEECFFLVAVVVCDMPELCKFPSLDSCQMRFLWTHNKLDILLHTQSVSSLVPQIGDKEKFSHALGFESLDSFFFLVRVSKQGPCLKALEENGDDKESCRA